MASAASNSLLDSVSITKVIDSDNKKENKEQKQTKRKLAYIVKIEELTDVPGASVLQVAKVLGWTVVVNKSYHFHVNDLAVYFENDSILDRENKEFAFLKGGVIRTRKIRNVLSQGLLMPLSCLSVYPVNLNTLREGEDMTTVCKVDKYISLDEEDKNPGARLPFNIPKSNEERLQSCPVILRELKEQRVIITRKEDGCSATYAFTDNKFIVCSRNYPFEKQESNHYFLIAQKYDLESKLRSSGRDLAIQGEIVGPKINKNRLECKDYEFKVFNIWNISRGRYLTHDEMMKICDELKLNTVPILYDGWMEEKNLNLDYFIEYANHVTYGTRENGNLQPGEGIVVKTHDRRFHFKVVSNTYLLKHNL